jgi:hypothetical protein
VNALLRAFTTYHLDRDALAAFDRPVYFTLGGLSNPDQCGEVAERLKNVVPHFTSR